MATTTTTKKMVVFIVDVTVLAVLKGFIHLSEQKGSKMEKKLKKN